MKRKYKILNLYACLGGNRYKWDEVAEEAGIELEVTAVEWDEELAKLYQERFPNDKVIVADAHQYLLDHYKEYDFIWSSPPCPSHSTTNHFLNAQGVIRYPDMKLYQEILFLNHFYKGKYVIENVKPYYEPLIQAQKRGRHLYWTNFNLPNILSNRNAPSMKAHGDRPANNWKLFSQFHEIDLSTYKGKQGKGKIARNLVDYEAGRTIFETILDIKKKMDVKQTELF
jgi:DNA (cytosine-5)-methyltransferase 1